MTITADTLTSESYLRRLGITVRTPATVAIDPGIAPSVLRSHLAQSSSLLTGVKLSMSTWLIASRSATLMKINCIKEAGVSAIAGGGPFEIASVFGCVRDYLRLCSAMGFDCIEVGEGFSGVVKDPDSLVRSARRNGLRVKYEIGRKFDGPFKGASILKPTLERWLSAGVEQIVVEAREDAMDVGLFNSDGEFNHALASDLLSFVGGRWELLQFEAPTKRSQFALLEHFGSQVILGNVPLDEILRVEIFRRGLHSRSFMLDHMRPRGPAVG